LATKEEIRAFIYQQTFLSDSVENMAKRSLSYSS